MRVSVAICCWSMVPIGPASDPIRLILVVDAGCFWIVLLVRHRLPSVKHQATSIYLTEETISRVLPVKREKRSMQRLGLGCFRELFCALPVGP